MKRVAFRFQRLLEVKESFEAARKIALGEAMAVLTRELRALADLQRTRAAHLQAAQGQAVAVLDPPLLGLSARYLQRLEREIGEQEQHLRQVEAIVADKRGQLIEAQRQRRVYEMLKERAWESHQRQSKRQQQIQLDEVGEQLHARRNGVTRLQP